MTHLDFDLIALYAALDEQRISRGMSWAAVTQEINHCDLEGVRSKPTSRGMAASTITGIKDRPHVEGDGVLQMLLWLRRTPESFIPGFQDADAARYHLPEAGRGKVLRWNTRALYSALDARRQARGMTWNAVAGEMGGYSAAMLTHLAKGGRTDFPRVMRIVGWLGEPAANFTHAVG